MTSTTQVRTSTGYEYKESVAVTELRSGCLLLENQYPRERQMLVERKVAFNQNADNLKRWWTQCPPKTISKDSIQPWKLLKRKREVTSINHWGRRSESSPSPTACRLACRLVDFLWSSDAILFSQFIHEMTEGEAREETWSSVNYLFFISTSLIYGKTNKLGKVLCDQKIWKVC